MGEALAALVRFETVRRVRAAPAALLALATLCALAAAYLLPGGVGGAAGPAALEAALAAVGALAGITAAGAASSIPADRASGAQAWVAASGAPAAARRAAPAISAAGLALVASLLAGLAALTFSGVTGLSVPTRWTDPVALPAGARLSAGAPAAGTAAAAATRLALTLPADAQGPLELDVRPVFRELGATTLGLLRVRTTQGDVVREAEVPVRGRVRLPTVGGGPVTVEDLDPRIDLVVSGARTLGPARSAGWNLLLAALVLGLGLAVGAPLAALLSRALSAPTATLSTALLLVVGVARDPLRGLAADAAAVDGGTAAAAVLRAATAIAPDLSGMALAGEAVAGRVLSGPQVLAALLPPTLFGAGALALLAFLPGPKGVVSLGPRALSAIGVGLLAAAAGLGALAPPRSTSGAAALSGARTVLAGTLFLRAEALRREGRVEELPALYRRILEVEPTSVRAVDHLADTLARDVRPLAPTAAGRVGWWREAIGLVDAALSREPDEPRLRWRRADLLLLVAGEDPDVARALEGEGRDRELEALRDLAAAARRTGSLPGLGRIHLEVMARHAPGIAAERYAEGRPGADEALALCDEVLRLRPDDLGLLRLDPDSPWTAGDRLRAGLRLVAHVRDDLAAVPPRTAEARALLDRYVEELGNDRVAQALRPRLR